MTFPNDACDAGSKNGTCYTKYFFQKMSTINCIFTLKKYFLGKNVLLKEAQMTDLVPAVMESAAHVIFSLTNILQRCPNYQIVSSLFPVAVNCGTTISENNTYFESKGSELGSCSIKICKCNSNVCQVNPSVIS